MVGSLPYVSLGVQGTFSLWLAHRHMYDEKGVRNTQYIVGSTP